MYIGALAISLGVSLAAFFAGRVTGCNAGFAAGVECGKSQSQAEVLRAFDSDAIEYHILKNTSTKEEIHAAYEAVEWLLNRVLHGC